MLVLSGGLPTTAMWDAQVPSFAPRHASCASITRATGAPVRKAASPSAHRTSLLALLDELGSSALVCGLSLGGMVGQRLGANAPERLERLVLACTGARLGDA